MRQDLLMYALSSFCSYTPFIARFAAMGWLAVVKNVSAVTRRRRAGIDV